MSPRVILFDGECRFCNRSVNWIIAHDPAKKFRFASQQSQAGQKWLAHLAGISIDSLILLEDETVYARSTAVLRIMRALPFPWSAFYIFVHLPVFLRDALYDTIASHRYRWFGTTEKCFLPTPELRERLLD